MTMQSMEDLFVTGLKHAYFAEQEILKALPKMAQAVQSDTLREAMEKHVEQTREQVRRLEEVFEICEIEPAAEPAPSFEGLMQEGEQLMQEIKDDPELLQAALIAAAQGVEHWEIATYGTLRAWAESMDVEDVVDLLQETLDEEKETDRILSEIAMEKVNEEAAAEGSEGPQATVGDGGVHKSAKSGRAASGEAGGTKRSQTPQRRRESQKEQRRS
jgi:ferritin-like metal-binding protein YciE